MEIDFLDIWKMIRKRFVLIAALVTVSVLTSGAVSFFVLKPEYEATTRLLVQNKNVNNELGYDNLITNQKLIKTYDEIIRSHRIAEDVIRRLNLDITSEELLLKVKVDGANESLVTSITVTDNDPAQAVRIANGFAQSFDQNLNMIMNVDNVSILDEAKLKTDPIPVRPKPYLSMAIALILSLMVGIGLAFLMEFLDKTVKTEEEIEELLGLPVLGVIAAYYKTKRTTYVKQLLFTGKKFFKKYRIIKKRPTPAPKKVKLNKQDKSEGSRFMRSRGGSVRLITLYDPKSPISEAYRTLRTNIQFAGISKKFKTLMVTSSGLGEGKTTTITNLAITIAQEGKKVMLIDADLRKPNVHRTFKISNQIGLSNLLTEQIRYKDVVQQISDVGLDVITSGTIPPNPAEILGSQSMQELLKKLKDKYDVVLIDTSPILPVTDGQLLASHVDGVLFVLGSGKVIREHAKKAKALLENVGANLIGAVLNNKKVKGEGYHHYYYGENN